MSFEITPTQGIKSSEEPANFNIPTNLVLTKISSALQFDYKILFAANPIFFSSNSISIF